MWQVEYSGYLGGNFLTELEFLVGELTYGFEIVQERLI
jgi:hypothetical protein